MISVEGTRHDTNTGDGLRPNLMTTQLPCHLFCVWPYQGDAQVGCVWPSRQQQRMGCSTGTREFSWYELYRLCCRPHRYFQLCHCASKVPEGLATMLSHSMFGIDFYHTAPSLRQLCALSARINSSICPSTRYVSLSQHHSAADVNTDKPPFTRV